MIKTDQLFAHDPTLGVYGDCMRATIASLLDLPSEAVPHFLYDNCNNDEYNERMSTYLGDRGLCYIEFGAFDLDLHLYNIHHMTPVYHSICDESPRFVSEGHAVVGCNGQVVHDPHPTKAGLPKVTENRVLGFIIVANMTKLLDWIRFGRDEDLTHAAIEKAKRGASNAE